METKQKTREALVVIVILIVSTKKTNGDGFVVPSEISGSCVAIETSYPISKILSSSPSSVAMNFAISPKTDYEAQYGPGSTDRADHQNHYQCFLKISEQINLIINNFLIEVANYIDYRKSAYLEGISKNMRRDIAQDGPLTENPLALPAFEPRGKGEKGEKIGSQEIESLIEEMSRVPFVRNPEWIAERLRREISGETETNDTQGIWSDDRRRFRRDPVSFVATVIAISSMCVSIGSTVYLSNRLEKLIDYVNDLSNSLEDVFANQKRIKNNLLIIKDAQGLTSLGIDQMGSTMKRFLAKNACRIEQTRLIMDLREIASKLDTMLNDIVSGTASMRLFPLELLKEMFKRTKNYRHTLVSTMPTTFFKDSAISVLKVDKSKQTLTLLLIAPRIERISSYQLIVIRSVETSFSVNGIIYGKRLHFDNDQYALPIKIYNDKKKSMNLTMAEIEQMRIPLDCMIENGVYMCRNFISISNREKFCILNLSQHKKEGIAKYCIMKTEKLGSHVNVSHSIGHTGTLLQLKKGLRLLGRDPNRGKLYQQDELTRMKDRDKSICIWAAAHYNSLQIVSTDGQVIETIKKDNKLFLKNAMLGHMTQFGTQHYSYIDDFMSNLTDIQFLNFTGIYDNVTKHWQTIKNVVIRHFDMTSRFGTFQIIAITSIATLGGFLLFKGFLFIRRKIKNRQNSYGQGKRIADNAQVTYDKDREVKISLVKESTPEIEDASGQPDEQIDIKPKVTKSRKRGSKVKTLSTVFEEEGTDEPPVMPRYGPLIGQGSDPVSQGASHHCDGELCTFCYARAQCENCNREGCRVCYLVSRQLKRLSKMGAISMEHLTGVEVKLDLQPTDKPSDDLVSKSDDPKTSAEK